MLLFETVDIVKDCLHIVAGVITSFTLKEEGLKKSLCLEMLATDLADYLVSKGCHLGRRTVLGDTREC